MHVEKIFVQHFLKMVNNVSEYVLMLVQHFVKQPTKYIDAEGRWQATPTRCEYRSSGGSIYWRLMERAKHVCVVRWLRCISLSMCVCLGREMHTL
jgi:hypothetical protein